MSGRLSRLDDIIGSETRNVIARHDLIEVVRSDKDRVPEQDAILAESGGTIGVLPPIRIGRHRLEDQILAAASPKVGIWGIELLDVKIKRLNYKQGVIEKIYDRMKSERLQIAERFRSEELVKLRRLVEKKNAIFPRLNLMRIAKSSRFEVRPMQKPRKFTPMRILRAQWQLTSIPS